MRFSSAFCYFPPVRFRYIPQHPVSASIQAYSDILLRAGEHISAALMILVLPYCLLCFNVQGYVWFLGIHLVNTVECMCKTRILLNWVSFDQFTWEFHHKCSWRFITDQLLIRYFAFVRQLKKAEYSRAVHQLLADNQSSVWLSLEVSFVWCCHWVLYTHGTR
jgi:hypothetical protein